MRSDESTSASETPTLRRRRHLIAAVAIVITAGLVLAPWGMLGWALVLLAATAWITVVQRVLHVRKQLMEAHRSE